LKESSAKKTFKNDFYFNSNNRFFDDLQTNLNVKDKYFDIKNASIHLKKRLLEEFIGIFSTKVNDSRNPKELLHNLIYTAVIEGTDPCFKTAPAICNKN
jgi:hypothetical protein